MPVEDDQSQAAAAHALVVTKELGVGEESPSCAVHKVVHSATGGGAPRLRPVFEAFWVPAPALGAGDGRPPEVLA